jgi:hypothetical protein
MHQIDVSSGNPAIAPQEPVTSGPAVADPHDMSERARM